MAGKKKGGGSGVLSVQGAAAGMLAEALLSGHDFIITIATGDDGERYAHLMTGPLVTPCMLGTLSNRCDMPEPGGCRHLVIRCKEKGSKKKQGI
ncbi:MAG TPA: hypothetical protein P5217_08350 [Methanoregulaceae archaeon]|nr:hypothetical protein [Methanoregulaceae archaeon]